MSRLGKHPREKGQSRWTDSSAFPKHRAGNAPQAAVTISSTSNYSEEYHGYQIRRVQTRSGYSEEFSGESGYNHLAPTSGKASVKIPDPSPDPSPDPKSRKGRRPKLPLGANRLSLYSICHSCRRPDKLCVLCSACPTPFCERCLAVRHGENVHEVYQPEIRWLCPKCRPGCGPGCDTICCNCSMCCNKYKQLLPVGRGEGRRMIKEATSAGWNLHDYQIHLQTKESKLEIANRKLCFGWPSKAWPSKASESRMHSNVIDKGANHLPTTHKGRVQKIAYTPVPLSSKKGNFQLQKPRTTTGGRSNHRGITASIEKRMYIDAAKKEERIIPYSHKELGSRMKREDLIRQSDQLPGHYYKRRQTILHQIDETIWDKEMDLEKITENNAWPDCSRKSAENDINTSHKALCNSLTRYSDLAPNIYLMRLWFDREKELTGNQMSISLTDREIQMKNSIKKRSLAGQIASEFNPAKLKSLPRNEQESMKQKLNDHLAVDLAEHVQKRLYKFYEDVDQQMARDLLKAKRDIDLAIDRMKAVLDSKVHPIPGHKVKEEYSR